jgi:predicted transcriptional regulator
MSLLPERRTKRLAVCQSPRPSGLTVKARHHELEITQGQLANDSGLHQRWISNVETGKRNPSYASLRRLGKRYKYRQRERVAKGKRIS